MKRYIIAHDIGTSGDKAALFTVEGEMVASHTAPYTIQHPKPGYAEQQPDQWWQAFYLANSAVLQGIDAHDIAGICITGQMMCCLPVDRQGNPLHAAMIWADCRAEAQARMLVDAVGFAKYYEITGMRASANYGLPKIMWLKTHCQEIYDKTYVFLSPKDYINWKLTGRFATDPENAAFQHCYDWREQCYSQEMLRASGIDSEKLPIILGIGTCIGATSGKMQSSCGLPAGIPVIMGPGDGGAATLGAAVLEPGEAYTCLGTSSWVCAVSGSHSLDMQQRTAKLNYLNTIRESGTMQTGGYARNWMERQLWDAAAGCGASHPRSLHALVDQAVSSVPPGSGGILFLPYLMGERSPVWDTRAMASFLGITAGTGKYEMCRSVLEGVALHLSWILNCIMQTGELEKLHSMKLVGGGAKSMVWDRIFADIYNMPVSLIARPDQAGALGTAVTAGVGLGLYKDCTVIREFQPILRTLEPDPSNAAIYAQLKGILHEAYEAIRPINHKLHELFQSNPDD